MAEHMTIRSDPFPWLVLARDAAGFAIAAGAGIAVWLRKRSSRYWPITFGKMESASSFEDGFQWLTDVSYSYTVEREFHSGQFQLRSRSERKATEQELRWKGRNIGVRYSPRNPQVSVVRVEDQAGLYGEEYTGH
jgi:hypothetical protein